MHTLEQFIEKLKQKYDIFCIGFSYLKQPIYVVKVPGRCPDAVIVQAAIHAREHITTDMWVSLLLSLHRKPLPTLYVVLQSNPDGVRLCKSVPLYKANARGVDLNNNFSADWGKRSGYKEKPSVQGYIGSCAESELETQVLVKFTKKIKPVCTISYHAKGEEIYFDFFNGLYYNRDKYIATIFANRLRYRVVPTQDVSAGGYKDWCVQQLHIPSLTIEVGEDAWQHPISRSYLPCLVQKHTCIFSCINQAVAYIQRYKKHDKRRKVDATGFMRSREST